MSEKPFGLSVKIAIKNPEGKLLFLRRSKASSWNPGRWDLPGGKALDGEKPEMALRREVREETGIDVNISGVHGIAEDETEKFRIVHIIMKGECSDCDVRCSSEHDDYEWFSDDEVSGIDLCPYLRSFFGV